MAERAAARVREDEALRCIARGTAGETGEAFFRALVRSVAGVLKTRGCWVTEYLPEAGRLRALAFWFGDGYVEKYEYPIAGTPCEPVLAGRCLAHFPDNLIELFPDDPDLAGMSAVSYLGAPFFAADGAVLGHLAVLDDRPMPDEPLMGTMFEIFALRAGAEYRRLQAERRLRDREAEVSRILDSAMDAILLFAQDFTLCRINPAGERVFGAAAAELLDTDVRALLTEGGCAALAVGVAELLAQADCPAPRWLAEGLAGKRRGGATFPAEATLSCFEHGGRRLFTLILRDVDERLAAEREIQLLTAEAEYRERLPGAGELLGESRAMRGVRDAIARVAGAATTVLVLGETGTGKELVASAIHRASARRDGPLVRVNCAAIPGALIESELFGHEAGAFTGATKRRPGRFALADGGTIFLDEVGELPLELQAKLLRVLQEGEIEPLGGTQTARVDVRVVAATNRDLERMVGEGAFRADLYYRLAVFPLRVPALAERGDDVVLLARAFVERLSRRMGRRFAPLDADAQQRLRAYPWPGNVRELQNVIERAILLSRGARLEVERALPAAPPGAAGGPPAAAPAAILTAAELAALERDNLLRALDATGWRVAGEDGAARRLGLPPSTVTSRMKALGIRRPPP